MTARKMNFREFFMIKCREVLAIERDVSPWQYKLHPAIDLSGGIFCTDVQQLLLSIELHYPNKLRY